MYFLLQTSRIALVLCLLSAGMLSAQTGAVSGVCSLPDTSDWSGITVAIDGQNISTITDAGGNFLITGIQPGTVILKAGKLLYSDTSISVVISPNSTTTCHFSLFTLVTDTLAGLNTGLFSSASTNSGNIGMPDVYITPSDSGFRWAGIQQLREGSLMTGISGTQVSDAARVIFGINQDNLDHDFHSRSGIVTLTSGPDSTVHLTAFDDSRSTEPPGAPSRPMGILITQRTSVYGAAGDNGFMMIELHIKNTTRFTLSNFLVGYFLDWDAGGDGSANRGAIVTHLQQIAGVNDGNAFLTEIAYQQASTGTGPFMGIIPLSQAAFKAARIASVAQEIAVSAPNGGLSEANKYAYMNERRQDSTAMTDYGVPEDLATIVSLGGMNGGSPGGSTFTLNAGEEIVVGFALAGGNTCDEMAANAFAAQRKWLEQGHSLLVNPSRWQLKSGWRLVSAPLLSPDMHRTALFPMAVSRAFGYRSGTGYVASDTLIPGYGYWIKLPADTTVTMTGAIIHADTISVNQGWNLIGGISYSVNVENLVTSPANIISSKFFGYSDTYYYASAVESIQGYWVKCKQAGQIILSTGR